MLPGEGHLEMCVERNECTNVMVHWQGNVRSVNTHGRSFLAWEHQTCKGDSYLFAKYGREREGAQSATRLRCRRSKQIIFRSP